MVYKICVKCTKEKSLNKFREYKPGKFRVKCKNCENKYSMQWFYNNHDYCKERISKSNFQRRLYSPWLQHLDSAKQRCTNPNRDGYEKYGKRGIKYLLSSNDGEHLWYRDSADLMDQPCIDRIDTNGNYTVENCQFLDKFIHDKKTDQKMELIRKKSFNCLKIRKLLKFGIVKVKYSSNRVFGIILY